MSHELFNKFICEIFIIVIKLIKNILNVFTHISMYHNKDYFIATPTGDRVRASWNGSTLKVFNVL